MSDSGWSSTNDEEHTFVEGCEPAVGELDTAFLRLKNCVALAAAQQLDVKKRKKKGRRYEPC